MTTITGVTPIEISSRLRRLRRGLNSWFLVEGVSRLLLVLLGAFALDFLIDFTFHMDRAQRVVMLFLMVGAAGYALWRWLLKPLAARPTDEALIREVEREHGGLSESMISALEFSRKSWPEGENVSHEMVEATIAEGKRQAATVDFDAALRSPARRRNTGLLVVLALAMLGVAAAVATTRSGSTWFNRNLMLGNAQWPLPFYLDVEGLEDGRLVVPRGDDWMLRVLLREGSRQRPGTAMLETRTGAGIRKESLDRLEGGRMFQRTLRNVSDEFSFRVSSGRFSTDWVLISLIDRPVVESVALRATPPAYTGSEAVDLPADQGPHYLLKGTELEVSGRSSKPLERALLRRGEQIWPFQVVDDHAFVTVLDAKAVDAGQYEIELYSTDRIRLPGEDEASALASVQPARFGIRAKPDKVPEVKAALKGIGNLVVPQARIPYTARIADDFAVTEALLVYRVRNDEKGESNEGAHVAPGLGDQLGKTALQYDDVFQLSSLQVSEGSSLSLFVEALDNDDVSGPKSGESSKYLLRVVSPAELRTDLLRREKEQRMAIEKLIREQDDLYTDTQSFRAETAAAAKLEAALRDRLVRLEKKQKLLGSNLPRIADRLAGLIEEARNNQLEGEDGVLQARLERKVIGPLRNLAANAVPMCAGQLEKARHKQDAAVDRKRALDQAVQGQQGIIRSLKTILSAMVKSAEFQEAVNLLYEIQQSQNQLQEQTVKEKETRVQEIFEKGGNE